VASVYNRQQFPGALKAVIDDQCCRDEADPDKCGRDQAVHHRHLVRAKVADDAGEHPSHDELGQGRNDKDRRFHAVGLHLFLGFADCRHPRLAEDHVIDRPKGKRRDSGDHYGDVVGSGKFHECYSAACAA
jgi:hypothetical protein